MDFRIKQYEYGWYVELYEVYPKFERSYCTNSLIASVLNVYKDDLKACLINNGAVDTANDRTYFNTEDEALNGMLVVKELYEEYLLINKLGNISLPREFVKNFKKSFTVL
jgi:hypothetical protein